MNDVIACPGCGSLEAVVPVPRGATLSCSVCGTTLERTRWTSVTAATALALSTLMLLVPANLLPLYGVGLIAAERSSRVASGSMLFWAEGFPLPAAAMLVFVTILPLVRFALLSAVLVALRTGRPRAWAGRAFRIAQTLAVWAMPEVMMLGIVVAYGRLDALFDLHFGWGGVFMGAAAIGALLTRAVLDERVVWRAIMPDAAAPAGDVIACDACHMVLPLALDRRACPRCAGHLAARKTNSIAITTALVAGGMLLYLPANLLPMALTIQLGAPSPYTVLEGVIDLYEAGLVGLAALVFCASFAIPLLKLSGMTWLLWSVRSGSTARRRAKTRLHAVIHEIGRWSMVDVLAIGTFVPLMQFGEIANAQAMPGMTAFLGVVVLTMLATHSFDPRLMWDAPDPVRASRRAVAA